jgi:hypothetical protein
MVVGLLHLNELPFDQHPEIVGQVIVQGLPVCSYGKIFASLGL